jgi:ADP-ribose pyrophosphatase YjhB (NUDIX family)
MKPKSFHPNHEVQRRYPREARFCPLCAGAMEPRRVAPDDKTFKVCPRCGFVYFHGPKLVAGCLVESQSRVLLLRRGIEPSLGKWTFPGGYVDLGETPAKCAIRETHEEVGMNVKLGPLLGVYADEKDPLAIIVVYLAEPGREPPGLSLEATEVRYFATADVPWRELAFPTTHEALATWVSRVEQPGNAIAKPPKPA